jgi:hypothetical protein
LLVDVQHSAMLSAALEQRLGRADMRQSACVKNPDTPPHSALNNRI